jgi:hypothetical protein
VPASELPAATTVIDRQEIESRQVTDVFQLLHTIPGLSVTQTGSRGGVTSVFPRGGNSNFKERFGGSLGVGYISTTGFLPINDDYRDFTVSSGLDYQPIEVLKLAFSARYSDSHFAFPTEAAGDRLSPLDPD